MSALLLLSFLSGVMLGCDSSQDDTGVDTRDLTREYRDPPEGGEQWLLPDMVMEPYSEAIWCYYGTYTGETVGVNFLQPFVSSYNHHAFIQASDNEETEDGTLTNCTSAGGMNQTSPLFEFTGSSLTSDGNYLPLPENSAIKLNQGQKWVIEAHFINPTPDRLIVNAAFNLGFLPLESVEQWVGSWQFDIGDLLLPQGEETTLAFSCDFAQEVSILTLAGHMHEYGRHHEANLLQDGSVEQIYGVEEWDAEYRDYPPLASWEPGELVVSAEALLETSCTWQNTADKDLAFPLEMCTTKGLALGLENAVFCVNGLHMNP